MPHILVVGPIHERGMDILRQHSGHSFETVNDGPPDGYRAKLGKADAAVIRTQPMTAEIVAEAPRMQIVSRHGVGYDTVDVAALSARSIPLTVVGDVNARTVAEQAMAMVLALAKQIQQYDVAVRNGAWTRRENLAGRDLYGRTLLIVGFGRIGRHLAGLAHAFGMTVLAYDPYVDAETFSALGVEAVTDLHRGLERADAVSVHAPKTSGTALIGSAELAKLKPGAWVVNTARGGIVDEAALAEALASGHVGGVGIDVFGVEPPARDNPLLGAPNAILSPHIAGLTDECAARMAIASVENVFAFFEGTLDPTLVVNAAQIGFAPAA